MKKKKGRLGLSNSFHYTLMILPGYIWLFMFSIVPMVGIVMAFQDYNPSKGWFGSPWVGLKWFKYLTVIPDAKRALVNTLIIAIAKVILNIIIPLVFALLLNEVKNMKFKKTVQTIVYLPHFVSWVILANIITNILGANGIFNTVRSAMGATDTVLPMTMPGIFRQLLIGTDVWKEFGYNAVIYLAALTGISRAFTRQLQSTAQAAGNVYGTSPSGTGSDHRSSDHTGNGQRSECRFRPGIQHVQPAGY